jgi:uncharacterized protein DUF5916
MRLGVALLLALRAVAALPAEPGDVMTATRVTGEIRVDGRLEEPDWQRAAPYDGFVQLFPQEGAPPSERTEVRVLYDDRALYVGIACLDSEPDGIVRDLARRDNAPYSDFVTVFVDSMRSGRTAYAFTVTAAGVQEDGLFFDDDRYTSDWDAVWDAAVTSGPDGWTAEIMIPFAALRFSDQPEQVWSFGVKRTLARRHEETASFVFRRNEKGVVQRLAPLVGLSNLRPVHDLELAPYTAARLSIRPENAASPRPRVLDPIGDVGLDLRSSIGRGLVLQATVNPDFGQVEADQIVQNLTTFELFYPEKRPFFVQGMDLFQAVGLGADRASPQQLFYSRRIGLDAPILAAAKLTGKITDTVQLGVVEAFVSGSGQGGAPLRSYRFDPLQPLHFAPVGSLPDQPPAPRNLFAAVARWQPSPAETFGASFTSALPAGPRCTQDDAALDTPPPRCDANIGNAAAVDWSLRTLDGAWFFRGQTAGSQVLGGPPSRVLPDGIVISRGDMGWGAYAAAGKQGGEPWRGSLEWEYESPRLELNALGYQKTQNEQVLRGVAQYVRPNGGGPFHSWEVGAGASARLTTDGRDIDRGRALWAWFSAQLRSFHSLGCNAELDPAAYDVREVSQAYLAYGRPPFANGSCWILTDRAKPLWAQGTVGYGHTFATGVLSGSERWGVDLAVAVRPHARLESRVDLHYGEDRMPARYVGKTPTDTAYWFGDLHAPVLSVVLREQLLITPRLTLQAYAQFYTTYAHHGPFYSAQARDGRIRPADLVPNAALDPAVVVANGEGRDTALNLTVVLRWEYRLGSTIYLVYARSQEQDWSQRTSAIPFTLEPRALAQGPTVDTFLVKWAYWFSR